MFEAIKGSGLFFEGRAHGLSARIVGNLGSRQSHPDDD